MSYAGCTHPECGIACSYYELPRSDSKMLPWRMTEQETILQTFIDMLAAVTQDGGRKRAAGTKPPWYADTSHEAAIFSHLNKWKHGERKDPDSGVHPLVHLAWRALALAYQETKGYSAP